MSPVRSRIPDSARRRRRRRPGAAVRPGSGHAATCAARSPPRIRGIPTTSRRWSAPNCRAATRSTCSPTATRSFRRCSRRSTGRGAAISFETYIYDTGEVATRFTEALERAARRGVTVNLVVDAVGASSMEKEHLERLRQAGCHVAQFNVAALVLARGNQLSNAPQDSRRRRRDRLHRRRRRRRSLARQRRLEGALARHAGARPRAGRAADGGRVLRELPRGRRRRRRPFSTRRRRPPARKGRRSSCAARRPAAATI